MNLFDSSQIKDREARLEFIKHYVICGNLLEGKL